MDSQPGTPGDSQRRTKLPPGCYWRGKTIWGRIKLAGREYRRSLLTDDPREARRRIKGWRQKLELTEVGIASPHTWEAAVIRWGTEVLPKAVKPQVMRRYLTSIVKLEEAFGGKRISDITERSIADYISSRSQLVSNATIRRDLTALSRLLSSCIVWRWTDSNPARTFDRTIIREQKKPIIIPSDRDIETMIAALPDGMQPVIRFLMETGMREDEAVTLEWSEVDDPSKQITLSKTKTNRPRTLAWKTPGGDAGRVLAAMEGRQGWIFPNRKGEHYSNFPTNFGEVARQVVAAEKAAKRPFRRFRAHDLRHRFAVRWLKAGGDIYRLSRHLGHTSVKTTEIYLRALTHDELDRVMGVAQTRAHPLS
jgi:integrase/recombinase XerD